MVPLLSFSGYKETTLIRRLQRRMQVLHLESATDYIERLKTDQSEVKALFRELLIVDELVDLLYVALFNSRGCVPEIVVAAGKLLHGVPILLKHFLE